MLVSFNWLREFVPYEGEPQALGDRLTMLGLELEGIEDPFAKIRDIVVGHVVQCDVHPESDHLSVCKLDVGDEVLDIVCGAPNVAKGQKVAVAKVGTELPGGLAIKKAKLRGVPSHGMICSERELELSDDHSGIWVLPENFKVGDKVADAFGMESVVLDFDITPNRADCLSILGFARETGLAFDLPVTLPALNLVESGGNAADEFRIVIDDPELCALYNGRIIRDIEQKAGPDWMRFRLLALGQRPISNIVDVTNYIMFELGQPLHSFDMDLLEGGMVRVAPAADGMKFTTLDNSVRTLTSNDLLIWDGVKPVGLAGVMGGVNSEMHAGSKNVFLEAAVFRPGTIRKTARRLALPSEASYRFERGVDQQMNRFCLDRAAQLMAETSGGTVVSGVATAEPRPWQDRTHGYRHDRCMRLLGLDLEPGFAKKVFELEGCVVDDADAANWTVTSPSHRLDLEREVDLYEEVGRVFGLDRIPAVLPRVGKSLEGAASSHSDYDFIMTIKRWGMGAGLNEAINYSFVGNDDLDRLGLPREGRVAIANPLSEDQSVLRLELAPGLLNTLRNNLAHANSHIRVFEVAKQFVADAESDTETREGARLGILLCGRRHQTDWPWPQGDADYLDIKGLVEHLLKDQLKLGEPVCTLADDHSYLEPCVNISLGDTPLGRMGMVKPEIADFYHAKRKVWLADLDLAAVKGLVDSHRVTFAELPKFPPSRRDVTVIGPLSLRAADIRAAMESVDSKLLESIELVAEYRPEQGAQERNLSFRLTYRSADKTLKDKQVDKEHARVLESLQKALPVHF